MSRLLSFHNKFGSQFRLYSEEFFDVTKTVLGESSVLRLKIYGHEKEVVDRARVARDVRR